MTIFLTLPAFAAGKIPVLRFNLKYGARNFLYFCSADH
jgi:hypothetical protein